MKTKIFFFALLLMAIIACKNEKTDNSQSASADSLIKNKIWYAYSDTGDYAKFTLLKVKDNHVLYSMNGLDAFEYKIEGDSIFIDKLPDEFHNFYKFKIEFISADSMVWQNSKHKISMRIAKPEDLLVGNWSLLEKNGVLVDYEKDNEKIYYRFEKDKTYKVDSGKWFNDIDKGTYTIQGDKILLKSGNKEKTINYFFES